MNETTAPPSAVQSNQERSERLLTRFDMRAALGGISDDKLYSLVREGDLPPPVKLGTSSRWLESDLEAFIARLAAAREAQPPPLGIRRHHAKLEQARKRRAKDLADKTTQCKSEVA